MAQAGNSLGARLRQLEKALAKAQKLKRGTKLTAEPMSQLVGVSWVQLRKWANDLPGFEQAGVFTRGGNGIEWEFRPVPTIRWLIAHLEAERKAKVERSAKVRKAIGGDALADVPEDMGLDEIAKMVRVARELREEQERQGRLVDRAKVETALEQMMTKMQHAGIKAAREQDPTGQFPPEIAEKFENAVNSVVLAMGTAGTEALRLIRGSAA